MFYGQREEKPCSLNSVMKPSELLCQAYIVYWYYAINIQPNEEKAEDIPIICELREVFRESHRDCSTKRN